jgi:hypothetical protein
MATALTPTSGTNLLKTVYSQKVTEATIARGGSTLWNLIGSDKDGSGNLWAFPTIDSESPSGSADFAVAQDSGNNSTISANQFQGGFIPIYSTFSVSNAAIVQSASEKGGWGPLLKRAADSAIRMNGHVMSNLLFGTGFGEVGTIDSSTALGGSVITLADKGDVAKFMKNMKLVLATAAASGALRNAGVIMYVQSVDYVNGTVTVAATANAAAGTAINGTWAAVVVGDVMCMAGCTNGSGTSIVPAGLPGWIRPDNNRPGGADSWFNVNRSRNPLFLGGYYDDATAKASLDAITDASQFLTSYTQAENLICGVNPKRWSAIAKSQQGNVRYTDLKGRAGMMFKAMDVSVEGTTVKILSDRYVNYSQDWVLDPRAFRMQTVEGQFGTFMDQGDGLHLCRQATDPGVEGRVWTLGAFKAVDPSKIGNIRHLTTAP